MKFLFKYPTLRRADWFKNTLNRYYSMLSNKHEYEFIVTLNKDDWTMNNPAMKMFLEDKQNLKFYFGDYPDKIAAINADIKNIDFDILFLISDDMIPNVQGFDDIIVKDMLRYFPDIDGALHYPDGCCNTGRDSAITLSIMGKKLYDHFGYIYHPSYKSFFCDNEFTDEAYRLNKAVFINKVIVSHDWSGGKQADEVYKRNTKLGKDDGDNYNKRKKLGFPRSENVHAT